MNGICQEVLREVMVVCYFAAGSKKKGRCEVGIKACKLLRSRRDSYFSPVTPQVIGPCI